MFGNHQILIIICSSDQQLFHFLQLEQETTTQQSLCQKLEEEGVSQVFLLVCIMWYSSLQKKIREGVGQLKRTPVDNKAATFSHFILQLNNCWAGAHQCTQEDTTFSFSSVFLGSFCMFPCLYVLSWKIGIFQIFNHRRKFKLFFLNKLEKWKIFCAQPFHLDIS